MTIKTTENQYTFSFADYGHKPAKENFNITISGIDDVIDYKFNEPALIKEFKEYVDKTYNQHYSKTKFQASEFIYDAGHGTGFNMGNVMKYAQRYGNKGTSEDARKDLMKVIHYAFLQMFVHDKSV